MRLALVNELDVLNAKGNAVKTHVVHSSLKVLTVGSGSLGVDPDIERGGSIDRQVLDYLNFAHRIPLEITSVDKGSRHRTSPTVRTNDVVPLIPTREVVISRTLIGVGAFGITVMNKRRAHVIGIPQPNGVIPSGTTEKTGPGIADVALGINPKGNRIFVQGHLGIVGKENPVVTPVEVECSASNSGQPLRRTIYGAIQFVPARIRGNRNRGIFVKLPMSNQVGSTVG